jgi:hypothetical protein
MVKRKRRKIATSGILWKYLSFLFFVVVFVLIDNFYIMNKSL